MIMIMRRFRRRRRRRKKRWRRGEEEEGKWHPYGTCSIAVVPRGFSSTPSD